ncbi:flagellar assembly peptidoglycan hydrolase FlgJ [Thalassotalea euphylliae]|uniref:Peptidoglycan hydrolase FlgJ n=1 Tax=Thalassotalea euphylliae TaxID=1655234 RepID=A0A3E0U259_9GAMM|nr:flagellar assembly peptidoglycan hydrolase FlgJ [Thalassotalea euphylliae]REL30295.1 flagellar assembly peptidoglycan hydrolase FlgJ [Thalassotalea euphylliae]
MDNKLAEARNFFDLNGLNNIRQQANQTDQASKKAALKEAAQQFESIFMQMLLKSMRSAQEVLEADSPFNSQSTKFYRDMQDQQMALDMSNKGTLGLAELIERQLGGGDGSFTPRSVIRTDHQALASQKVERDVTRLAEQFLSGADKSADKVSNNRQAGTQVPLAKANSVVKTSEKSSPEFNQPQDFVTALTEPAKQVERQLGVPFQVVIAQAALETGWGQKIIKNSDGTSSNNLFNIKADSRWTGEKAQKDTLEFEQGSLVKKNEPFRVYNSISESVNDYVNFLSSGTRYQDALAKPDNVEHFLLGLQKAGYATDPNYANKILGTLKSVSNFLNQ